MKSILKIMLKNRIVTLIVINIAIIIWIVWYQGQIQYEPLLDFSNSKERILPLHPEVYNTIIVIIVLNIIAVFNESRRIRNRNIVGYNLVTACAYLIFVTLCMISGFFYISNRTVDGVVDEYNTLFRFPIWLFGKDSFTSVITVINLYLLFCVIHIITCLFYMYFYIKYGCKSKKL